MEVVRGCFPSLGIVVWEGLSPTGPNLCTISGEEDSHKNGKEPQVSLLNFFKI